VPDARVEIEVHEDRSRSIVSENKSPDVGFRFSVNPYRGCQHACAYCYARPTHEYLGFGAGTDFERKLLVKKDAPALLAAHFQKPSWQGDLLAFSGVTDCYQPLEANRELTRGCLRVCLEFRNPVAVITKAALVLRDADLLAELAREARANVYLSIPFADPGVARALEPGAPPVDRRFETMARLADAGVPVGISIAPVIPGLNDSDAATLLARARDSGARSAFHILLRLPGSSEEVFLRRLRASLPDRASRVENRIREVREGRLDDPRFGHRQRGSGPYWAVIEQSFRLFSRKLGLAAERGAPGPPTTFRRPPARTGQTGFGW